MVFLYFTQTGGNKDFFFLFFQKLVGVYICEIFRYRKGGHNILSYSLVKSLFWFSHRIHIVYASVCGHIMLIQFQVNCVSWRVKLRMLMYPNKQMNARIHHYINVFSALHASIVQKYASINKRIEVTSVFLQQSVLYIGHVFTALRQHPFILLLMLTSHCWDDGNLQVSCHKAKFMSHRAEDVCETVHERIRLKCAR